METPTLAEDLKLLVNLVRIVAIYEPFERPKAVDTIITKILEKFVNQEEEIARLKTMLWEK